MSPYLESIVDRIALNAKMANPGHDGCSRMIAASYSSVVQLWQISDNGQSTREIGWYPVLCLDTKVWNLLFLSTDFYMYIVFVLYRLYLFYLSAFASN